MNNKTPEVILRYIIHILILVALVGCGASVKYGDWPYKEASTCIPGDKNAAWDDYAHWNNTLLETRRLRQEYCVWSNAYTGYCSKLEIYHTRVEKYVAHLLGAYTNTCPTGNPWF